MKPKEKKLEVQPKYYLSFNGGSGIKCNTIDEVLGYLKDELIRIEVEEPNSLVDICLDSYEEDDE